MNRRWLMRIWFRRAPGYPAERRTLGVSASSWLQARDLALELLKSHEPVSEVISIAEDVDAYKSCQLEAK